MAANKIILNGETILDLTNDTVTAEDVAQGKIFHLANGEVAVGTASGGGTPSEGAYTCTVYDYDGTILLQQKGNSGDTVTLPSAPTHDRLVFQEWSATCDIVDNTVTFADNDIAVGAIYETASGNTEFDIVLTKVTGLTVTLQNLTGMTSIDWGDGTTDSNLSHTYSDYGEYTIQVVGVAVLGEFIFSQGSGTFNYFCTAIRLRYGVTSIRNSAFQNCSSLTSVTIPNSVTGIWDYVFYYCYSLTSVTIPNSVTIMGYRAFSNCYSLTSVTIPNSVTIMGNYTFSDCYSLTSVTIPNSVTIIVESMFYYCYSLTSVTIPNSVTSIRSSAFSNCYSIILYDFSQCTSVSTLIGTSTFRSINGRAKIVVPDNLYDEWVSATNWVTYADYIYKASEVDL